MHWMARTNSSCSSATALSTPSNATAGMSSANRPNTSPQSTNIRSSQWSEELFSHTQGYTELQDAQDFMQIVSEEEDCNIGANTSQINKAPPVEKITDDSTDITDQDNDEESNTHTDVPDAVAYCEVESESEVDDVDVDVTWVPERHPEESDDSLENERESASGRRRREIIHSAEGNSPNRTSYGVSQTTSQPPMGPTSTSITSRVQAQSSAAWKFFCVSAADNSKAICNLCHTKISRGKPNTHLGTTSLRRHLTYRHKNLWEEHLKTYYTESERQPSAIAPSASCPSSADSHVSISSHSTTAHSSRSCSQSQSDVSVKEMFEKKKMWAPTHTQARRLTTALSELLARQLLPYALVDSEAFKKFAAIGTPQWKVPERHFFSSKGIPDLSRHVQFNIKKSLANSVGAKVHLTTDTWSSKHGQGRYMTVTAHWANIMQAGKNSMAGSRLQLVSPPRIVSTASSSSPSPSPVSSSLPSSTETCSADTMAPNLPKGYASCQVQRCHAVLRMLCLESKSHTGPALLAALNTQAEQWLTPHKLSIGNVVSDNGSNLLSAFRLGKLTHVPCMAHVANLIVQRFLERYPGFQEVLKLSRKVSAHFRRSYKAMARLSEIQRRHKLPVRRLICDSQTRWNSTLNMFERLVEQKHAVNEYLCELASKTASTQLGIFLPRHWLLMSDACRLLRPFEEVTKMVSRSDCCISDTIPLIFFLKRAIKRILEQALEEQEQEQEEESGMLSEEDPFGTMPSIAAVSGHRENRDAVVSSSEDDNSCDDEVHDHHSVQPTQSQTQQQHAHLTGTGRSGIVRGWGDGIPEEELFPNEDHDLGTSASNLYRMASFIFSCFNRDPRIQKIRDKDLYWVSTLLDPRYKMKMSEMLPQSTRQSKMQHFQQTLKEMLYFAFPLVPARGPGRGRGLTSQPTPKRPERSGSGDMLSDMRSFFRPIPHPHLSTPTHREHLDHQIADYIGLTADFDSLCSEEPLQYWASRMELWPQLSQLAMELLSCPTSSVLSERTFSAAGGIVTDKRNRLGHSSVDNLTFIKMNESWISEGYCMSEDL